MSNANDRGGATHADLEPLTIGGRTMPTDAAGCLIVCLCPPVLENELWCPWCDVPSLVALVGSAA